MNEKIFAKSVQVISADGQNLGVMETSAALNMAYDAGLDLVEIAYDKANACSNCKFLDYSKFVYEQKKREKEAKKQARANEVDVKEMDFSIRIDSGDMETKVRQIKKFLEDGDKVKIVVKLLRRESKLKDYAISTMKSVISKLDGLAEFDSMPSANGNILTCVIHAKKQ